MEAWLIGAFAFCYLVRELSHVRQCNRWQAASQDLTKIVHTLTYQITALKSPQAAVDARVAEVADQQMRTPDVPGLPMVDNGFQRESALYDGHDDIS